MTKSEQKISRFLSLVLRHDPATIGLKLDSQGWADVDELLACLQQHGKNLSLQGLENIVTENNKQRYAFSEDGARIRAALGHSIEIDLKLTSGIPPEYLYHGTATRFMDLIEKNGLSKMSRQHVHLSRDIPAAYAAGKRHGQPIILEVSAKLMADHGHPFFLAENGVWLTDSVSPDYLARRFSL